MPLILAGMLIGFSTLSPLLLFHFSAPAMVLACLGGFAVGMFVVWLFAVALVILVFHD
jgi:hypothetical protein